MHQNIESFCRFFVKYGDSLPYGHEIEKWQFFLNLYEGLKYETREFIDDIHFNSFLNQTRMLYLNFFRCLAKDTFKKEFPGFPPLDIPLTYPFDHDAYGDTPIGDEVEMTRSVMRWSRAFEESLGTHDPLMPLALDHDLAPPSSNDYSLPPLDDQTMDESCDDM